MYVKVCLFSKQKPSDSTVNVMTVTVPLESLHIQQQQIKNKKTMKQVNARRM